MPFDLLILYAAASAAIAGILIFAHALSRRYLRDDLRYYFYHLLLAGLLALLGKPFPVLIASFARMEAVQADRLYLMFDRLLAKPLWIGALYLLVKCLAAMAGRKPARSFTIVYFCLGGGLLAVAWMSMITFLRTDFMPASGQIFSQVFNYLDVFFPLIVFGWGIFVLSPATSGTERQGLRTFSWIGLVTRAVFWSLILLSFSFTVPFLFGVVLPVPALLYLSAHLKKTSPQGPMAEANPESLETFYFKHDITPREKEIITLVCAGRGNQAIADALFISIHTVKRHVNQVYRKVGVRNRVQLANAVRAALQQSPRG